MIAPPHHSPWRYALFIPIMIVLAAEMVGFVKLIAKFRKPYVPLLALTAMFSGNFILYDLLLFDPTPVEQDAPAAVKPPPPASPAVLPTVTPPKPQ